MGQFLTTASALQCPHGGTVSASTSNTRTKADGAYVVRAGDTFSVAGCPFTLPGTPPVPHPCVRVQWLTEALRNSDASDKPLTTDSLGMCLAGDGAPQGSVIVANTQARQAGQ
jgi:hypothetical protein